jgi:hypothetical protein
MAEEHWPDQFAFRIVALEASSCRVMISRVDKGSSESSWGAKLIARAGDRRPSFVSAKNETSLGSFYQPTNRSPHA